MIYDMTQDFFTNIDHGPYIDTIPSFDRVPQWTKVFDYQVLSPVGLFACPFIVAEQGVKFASQLGFDVITWKTIRNEMSEPHPQPNVAYVQQSDDGVVVTKEKSTNVAVSIGNSSYGIERTFNGIKNGVASLQKGQILICSIYGVGETQQAIIDDFVILAQRVAHAGVHALELNCSCPNVTAGLYYKDPAFIQKLVGAVTKAVSIPVTIKVGIHDSKKQLQELLCALAQAGGRGITGINAIGMNVLNPDGTAYFGKKRKHAGVCGEIIQARALCWVREVAEINEQEKLDLTILGGGGIITADQFDLFFDAGAHVGMTASGAMIDPTLAINYHTMRDKKINPQVARDRSEYHVV